MALTVTMLESQKDVHLDGKGDFIRYHLTVDEGGKTLQGVELFQKKDSVPPKVGETYENWKTGPGKFGLKVVKEPKVGGFGGGFRPRDPRETAAIQRQHSQEMALRWAAVQASRGALPEDFTIAELKAGIDWFQRDIQAGVNLELYGAKEERAKEPVRTGQSDVPSAKPDEFVHLPDDGKGTAWET